MKRIVSGTVRAGRGEAASAFESVGSDMVVQTVSAPSRARDDCQTASQPLRQRSSAPTHHTCTHMQRRTQLSGTNTLPHSALHSRPRPRHFLKPCRITFSPSISLPKTHMTSRIWGYWRSNPPPTFPDPPSNPLAYTFHSDPKLTSKSNEPTPPRTSPLHKSDHARTHPFSKLLKPGALLLPIAEIPLPFLQIMFKLTYSN